MNKYLGCKVGLFTLFDSEAATKLFINLLKIIIMKKLGRRNYYAIGSKKFEAWYKAMTTDEMYEIEVRRYKNFDWWDENALVFDFEGKTYSECGIDNFNGHFSGYTDRGTLYGIYLREVIDA